MDVEAVKRLIERRPNLSTALGMDFVSTPENDICKATMTVDERNRQPFGFLSGGASLALAENVAGVGSLALCPDKICVGISVSGNHVKAVAEVILLRLRHDLSAKDINYMYGMLI